MKQAKIVILPIASYEQHGQLLPWDTDITIASFFAEKVHSRIDDSIVLPAIHYGIAEEHPCNSISVHLEKAIDYWMDILCSIRGSMKSVKLVVIINGHGGNQDALKAVCNSFNHRGSGTKAMVLGVFQPQARQVAETLFGAGPAHADSAEASVYAEITGISKDIEVIVEKAEPHSLFLFSANQLSDSGVVSKTGTVMIDKNAAKVIIKESLLEMELLIKEYIETISVYEYEEENKSN